ncbi:hypothetical protein [Hyphomicrobium sulfonivorans]|uniref:hypothetical protein n=1 Tax=Hyphomicrobium sulfonivorans TaxID=121290 RepID=UPI001570F207|nr:hypothetical protein [Hyphomicrobium sulfonivorans]MBI1650580.1 hypothetical protein [Hyphomicrobium sulfonivorans]
MRRRFADRERQTVRYRTLIGAWLAYFATISIAIAEAKLTTDAAAAAGVEAVAPDGHQQSMLIRTTLIALTQANQTGNYSVLRDLGTPLFQASNTDARLGEIFAALRSRNLDFSPILFFDPKLVRAAAVQPNGMLRLTGYIDTRPERILFDMGFERVDGHWRLSAIVVDMQTPPDAGGASGKKTHQKPPETKGAAKKPTALKEH